MNNNGNEDTLAAAGNLSDADCVGASSPFRGAKGLWE